MSRLPLSTLLTCALLFIACGESSDVQFTIETRDGVPHAINRGWNVWADSAAAPLQFQHERTFGTNEGSGPDFLGDVQDVAVDSMSTLYVLDDENHRVVAFDAGGDVKWSGGRQGEGPGEFDNPRRLLVRSDRLYIENKIGRQLDIWTTSGEFVERQNFAEKDLSLLSFVGFAEGFLVASETGFGDTPQRIRALDLDSWEVAHTFPVPADQDLPEGFAMSASVTAIGDTVYSSKVTDYVLRRYTVDGTQTRIITREIDILHGAAIYESGDRRSIRSYSSLGAPLQLASGHLLVNASWASNVDDANEHYRRAEQGSAEDIVWTTTLDLFSPKGRYRGSLRWDDRREPPLGDPAAIGPGGKLYTTTSDPFPQIRRYDVTIKDQ